MGWGGIVALLLAGLTVAASSHIETWGTDKGLPNSTVTALAQTPDGYLWVGTPSGLARFDGVRFTAFKAQIHPALGDGGVRSLATDSSGVLWIGMSAGELVRMDDADGKVVRSAIVPAGRSAIQTLVAASQGTLWFATARGALGRLKEDTFLSLPTISPMPEGPLKVLAGFRGAVRVSGSKEMILCAGEDGLPQRVAFGPELMPLTAARNGGWWFSRADELRLWRGDGWVAGIPLSSNAVGNVQSAIEDSRGQLWVGSEQRGLFCFSTNAPVQHLTMADGLGSEALLCLFEDARGAIWAGTERGGLSRVRHTPFRVIGRKDGLSSEFVTSVCEASDNEVWVGTDGGGLNLVKQNSVEQPTPTDGLHIPRIRALCLDTRRSLWLATPDGRLLLGEAGVFKERSALTSGALQISALFEDRRWQLWLGATTTNQLVRLVSEAPQIFNVPNPSPTLDVRCFAEDAEGRLLIGTEGSGLFRWDGRDFRQFKRADGLGADTVWALLADPQEPTLWIGTSGGGLSCLRSNALKTCGTRNGLHDDVICHLVEDGQGWLWFGSHRGIFRVAKAELVEFFAGQRPAVHSVVYGLADGLLTLECAGGIQPAGCQTRDGRLWFTTTKGLVVLNPAEIVPDLKPPSIRIEELLLDDSPQPSESAELLVKPGSHRFLFRFTALGAEAPERLRFRSRLDGLDPDWVDLGDQRSVQYNGLRPGQYRFRVSAINRDGIRSEADATFAFRVAPQFWETWWFRLAGALTLAGSVAAFVTWTLRRRHRARIERLERLHAVEQERARIAQDIHDDLGASLTQIALLSELAQSQLDEPQAARGHLDHIFTNARNLARATDEIVWALHPKNNAVELSLSFLTRFAQEYLRVAGIACRLDFPTELPDASLPSATRHHLYLALKEALNNVVKHANATEVWLRLACGEGQLSLTIEDNGCGFDPQLVPGGEKPASGARRGHGLDSMAQRMKAAGGTFEQTSAPGKGTLTRFTVPLQS